MVVKVCVGSACYVKGSHVVIKTLENLINTYRLGERVELKASFCLEHCTQAVAVQINDEFFEVEAEKVEEFFNEQIKGRC